MSAAASLQGFGLLFSSFKPTSAVVRCLSGFQVGLPERCNLRISDGLSRFPLFTCLSTDPIYEIVFHIPVPRASTSSSLCSCARSRRRCSSAKVSSPGAAVIDPAWAATPQEALGALEAPAACSARAYYCRVLQCKDYVMAAPLSAYSENSVSSRAATYAVQDADDFRACTADNGLLCILAHCQLPLPFLRTRSTQHGTGAAYVSEVAAFASLLGGSSTVQCFSDFLCLRGSVQELCALHSSWSGSFCICARCWRAEASACCISQLCQRHPVMYSHSFFYGGHPLRVNGTRLVDSQPRAAAVHFLSSQRDHPPPHVQLL